MVWALANTYLTLLYKCKSPRSYIKNNDFYSDPEKHILISMFYFGNFEYLIVEEEYLNMKLSLNELLERAKEEGIDRLNINFQKNHWNYKKRK